MSPGAPQSPETILEWMTTVLQWAESKGWNRDLVKLDTLGKVDSIGKQLLLMTSEITEAFEEIRSGQEPDNVYYIAGTEKPEGFGIELADCVIRIFHTCAFYNINLQEMLERKMSYNETRAYRHGDKLA